MSKNNIICSLTIRNKKGITRSIGTGILGPMQAGLFHFKSTGQVNHAVLLEKNNQITILSPIPSYILAQLQGGTSEPVTQMAHVEVIDAESLADVVEEKPVQLEKGNLDWYLTWEEVESKSKSELLEWFEKNPAEGLSLPKNKSAAATKEIVHTFLDGQFEDHVAPTESIDSEE